MGKNATRGQVLPLIALCLAVLTGFAGLAVDIGYWEYQQDSQQTATDAAAIGAAQELVYQGCPNQAVAQSSADTDAGNNGFRNGGNVTITVSNPPSSGPYSSSNCAVSVQMTSTHIPSFFSRWFFGFKDGATVTTSAVAALTSNGAGCIYMLEAGQNTNFHGATVNTPYCAILLNGSANFNAATANAAMIGEVDYAGSNNSGTFTQATPSPILNVADPCPEISGCAYLTANPPSTSPCNSTYNGLGTLYAGCYNNLNMNGATVTLAGGLYIFAGGSNFNKAALTATSGVTIYIPSGASTNFNKVSSFSLVAPSSGNYAGVAYYQVKANTTDVNFNGSSTSVAGLIYSPTATINYNGSGDLYTILVGAYANFNNSNPQDFASPAPGQSPIVQQAILAE